MKSRFPVGGAVGAAALSLVLPAAATSPPVGPLPPGPKTTVVAKQGTLVAIAVPQQAGRSWRVARQVKASVLRQVGEGDVGPNVVVVFRAVGRGAATVKLAQTRGEGRKAFRAITYAVRVV